MAANKFKLGDHVRDINEYSQTFRLEGVVVRVVPGGFHCLINYGPDFDGHDDAGSQTNNNNWWMREDSLALIKEEQPCKK